MGDAGNEAVQLRTIFEVVPELGLTDRDKIETFKPVESDVVAERVVHAVTRGEVGPGVVRESLVKS